MKRQRSGDDAEVATERIVDGSQEEALHTQILAALKAKKYKEASRLSAEAWLLQEENAIHTSQDRCRGKSIDVDVDDKSGVQKGNGDEEDAAISNSAVEPRQGHEATEVSTSDQVAASLVTGLRAIISAMRHIDAAKSLYQEGCNNEASASLKLAFTEAEQLIGPDDLCDQIQEVKTAWKLAPILKLNDDVLLEVFRYFDTPDMLSCWEVNQHWQELLTKPLQYRTLKLEGTVEEIDEQWERYGDAMQEAGVTKLDVCFKGNEFDDYLDHKYPKYRAHEIDEARRVEHDEDLQDSFRDSSLYKYFPEGQVESITFSSDSMGLDLPFWQCLVNCKKLKSIKWDFDYEYEDVLHQDIIKLPDFKVAGRPLAKCRLEKIDISASKDFKVENEFKRLCKAAKSCRVSVAPNDEDYF